MSRFEPFSYIGPTPETGRLFVQRGLAGPVVMLNLLKFRDAADFSAHPELAPAMPISGAEAFDRYVWRTAYLVKRAIPISRRGRPVPDWSRRRAVGHGAAGLAGERRVVPLLRQP